MELKIFMEYTKLLIIKTIICFSQKRLYKICTSDFLIKNRIEKPSISKILFLDTNVTHSNREIY